MFPSMSDLQALIISHLRRGAIRIVDLIEILRSIRPQTTKQGVYQAIRELKSEDIVVSSNKRVSLSSLWIQKMDNFFSVASSTHRRAEGFEKDFLSLQDGEGISYTFRGAINVDRFWNHAIVLLSEQAPEHTPIFFVNNHYWFIFSRSKSEIDLHTYIQSKKSLLLNTSHGNTPLDSIAARKTTSDRIQYAKQEDPRYKKNYYLIVIGDFIIDALYDEETTGEIESIYQKHSEPSEDMIQELASVTAKKRRIKTRVLRSAKRAQILRRRYARNFVISEEFRKNL